MFRYLLQTYTIRCNNRGTRCFVEPPIADYSQPFTLNDAFLDPNFDPTVTATELSLSPDLAMFLTYLLRCFAFHLLGLLLCWACTFNFRRTL